MPLLFIRHLSLQNSLYLPIILDSSLMEVSAVTHPIPSHSVVLLSCHLNFCLFLLLLSSLTVIVGFVFLLLYCPSTLVNGGYRSCTSLVVDVVRIVVWRSMFFIEDAVRVHGIVAAVFSF